MRNRHGMIQRAVALPLVVIAIVGLAALAVAPAGAQVPLPAAVFSGYSTGTYLHTDALSGLVVGPRLANVDEAFSGASVASQGTGTVQQGAAPLQSGRIVNEMGVVVQPPLPTGEAKLQGNRSFARGSGLEVGVAEALPVGTPTIPLNKAQVSAPPANEDVKEVGPVNASPLAFATLLRGEAKADFNNNNCILGKPMSEGKGLAADAQLLATGTTGLPLPTGSLTGSLLQPILATDAANRAVASSRSITQLVAPTTVSSTGLPTRIAAPGAGLLAETRQTLAPVTLFKGTPQEITIEILGEFVLQAVAGGVPGSAYVRFAPAGSPSPTTPIVRILQPPVLGSPVGTLPVVNTVLSFQDLFGNTTGGLLGGLTGGTGTVGSLLPVTLPSLTALGISITAADNPRRIDSDDQANPPGPDVAADGTSAAGAVDVLRVKVLSGAQTLLPGFSGADIRIGHIEARAQVPVGGVLCRAGIAKDANPRFVRAGDRFTYDIDVENPFDCTLTGVRVTDTINGSGGIQHRVLSTNPQASVVDPPAAVGANDRRLTFNDVGPIAPRSIRRVTIEVEVARDAPSGFFTDEVTREAATCDGVNLDRPLLRIDLPRVEGLIAPPVPRFQPPLPPLPPPPPLPFAPPAVLRTDIVRPVLPFTGFASLPMMATAAFLLALGGWLVLSSGRVATAGAGLAFPLGDGGLFRGRRTSTPSRFQAAPVAAPPAPTGTTTAAERISTAAEPLFDWAGPPAESADDADLFPEPAPARPARVIEPPAITVLLPSLLDDVVAPAVESFAPPVTEVRTTPPVASPPPVWSPPVPSAPQPAATPVAATPVAATPVAAAPVAATPVVATPIVVTPLGAPSQTVDLADAAPAPVVDSAADQAVADVAKAAFMATSPVSPASALAPSPSTPALPSGVVERPTVAEAAPALPDLRNVTLAGDAAPAMCASDVVAEHLRGR